MALEPTENTPTTDGGQTAISAMEAAFLAPSEAPAAAAPTPPVVEAPPVVEETPPPAEPTDPLKEIENAADPKVSKLPIDEEEPAAEPENTPPPKDKAGYRIQELTKEIKNEWKPKVATLEQQIAERDARMAELKAQAEEAERLKEQLKSYEAEMSIVKLEKTPAYIKEVAEPFEKIQTKTDSIIETYSLDREKVYAAFAEPDEGKRRAALKEATAGLELDVDDQVELRALARDVQPLYAKRDELYANADKALAELAARSEQETAAQAAARAEDRAKAAELVAKRVVSSRPSLKAFISETVIASVKDTDIDALDPQNKAYNHLAGLALPKLEVAYSKLIAERDKLLDEIAAFQKADPRVGDGLGHAGVGEGRPKTIEEALMATARG